MWRSLEVFSEYYRDLTDSLEEQREMSAIYETYIYIYYSLLCIYPTVIF
jgi:hypothetical protein